MSHDVMWIDMMFSEGIDNGRSEDRSLEFSPSICSPVHYSRNKIDQELCDYKTCEGGHRSLMIFDSLLDEQVPKIEAKREIDRLPEAQIPRIVVFP